MSQSKKPAGSHRKGAGFTIPAAAEELGISYRTLKRAIELGQVATVMFGGVARLPSAEVARVRNELFSTPDSSRPEPPLPSKQPRKAARLSRTDKPCGPTATDRSWALVGPVMWQSTAVYELIWMGPEWSMVRRGDEKPEVIPSSQVLQQGPRDHLLRTSMEFSLAYWVMIEDAGCGFSNNSDARESNDCETCREIFEARDSLLKVALAKLKAGTFDFKRHRWTRTEA